VVGEASRGTPEIAQQLANRWEGVGRRLLRVAQLIQDYLGRVRPIAQGVEQVVRGSATGKDKEIAALLQYCAQEITRSAAATHEAAQVARRLAAQAHAEAQEMRRQQSGGPHGR
jgi:hypothetical protein